MTAVPLSPVQPDPLQAAVCLHCHEVTHIRIGTVIFWDDNTRKYSVVFYSASLRTSLFGCLEHECLEYTKMANVVFMVNWPQCIRKATTTQFTSNACL